jgi:hypothetical protein
MNSTQFSPDYLARNRLKGAALTKKEKEIIINVYCYFRKQDPEKMVKDVIKETAVCSQFSVRSVWRIKGEMKNSVFERINIKDGKKKCVKYKKPASKVYDNYVLSAIRIYIEIVCGVVLLT